MCMPSACGLRYKTPIGPVRLDLAYSIHPPTSLRIQGHARSAHRLLEPDSASTAASRRCRDQRNFQFTSRWAGVLMRLRDERRACGVSPGGRRPRTRGVRSTTEVCAADRGLCIRGASSGRDHRPDCGHGGQPGHHDQRDWRALRVAAFLNGENRTSAGSAASDGGPADRADPGPARDGTHPLPRALLRGDREALNQVAPGSRARRHSSRNWQIQAAQRQVEDALRRQITLLRYIDLRSAPRSRCRRTR